MKTIKLAALVVLLLGIIGLGIGGAFVGIGFMKNNQIATYLRAEEDHFGAFGRQIAKGDVVDNITQAQNAAQLLTKHRQSIAPTYNDLLGGKPYDPTKRN